ncbi:MAG: (d)CMP kinase [Gammaproteobacteria bacterium]
MKGSPPAPVIAVDGPSGTGKGTLCVRLARHLGWHFLDSGALYRVLAALAERSGLSLGDGPGLARLAATLDIAFREAHGGITVHCSSEDLSEVVRTESCGVAASKVAALPEVRAALLSAQKGFRRDPGLVADGRDMGTVVFPDARLKVFLTASPEARAERRHNQLKHQGINVRLATLRRDIGERDVRDRARTVSPLRPAPDAVVVDTSDLGIDAVFARILALVSDRDPGRG